MHFTDNILSDRNWFQSMYRMLYLQNVVPGSNIDMLTFRSKKINSVHQPSSSGPNAFLLLLQFRIYILLMPSAAGTYNFKFHKLVLIYRMLFPSWKFWVKWINSVVQCSALGQNGFFSVLKETYHSDFNIILFFRWYFAN